MVKINRTTEYSLMAISYIRNKPQGEVSSAREISEHYGVPFEILAKTLQKLKEKGIIASTYGTRGGYILSKDLNTLNLGLFLKMMEGPVSVVSCCPEEKKENEPQNHSDCEYHNRCNIKGVMFNLNGRISDFLNRITLEELTRAESSENNHPASVIGIAAKNAANARTKVFQGEEP